MNLPNQPKFQNNNSAFRKKNQNNKKNEKIKQNKILYKLAKNGN